MAQVFDLINDVALSYDGDLILDDNGDLQTISGIEWFKREVNKIIRTRLREWRSEPDIGMDTEDFTGRINSRETAVDIKRRILEALTIDNFQSPGQFDIQVVPVSSNEISIFITYNIMGESYSVSKLLFNLDRNISQPITDELVSETQNTMPNKKKEVNNKYLKALMSK